jgi:hypothetical protein
MSKSRIETALLDYQIKCSQSSWLQNFECARYSLYNKIINITSIIITSVTATTSVIINSFENKNGTEFKVVETTMTILLYFTAILTSLQHFLDYEKKTETHRTSSVRFNNLANNIKRTLVLDTEDQKTLEEYFKWVSGEYDNISGASPTLSLSSLNEFKKNFGMEIKTLDNMVLSNELNLGDSSTNSETKEAAIRYEIDRFLVNSYSNEIL